LNGTFLSKLLKPFLKLLTLERVLECDTLEYFWGKIGDTCEGERFSNSKRIANIDATVI
jgi:hypothetical protein